MDDIEASDEGSPGLVPFIDILLGFANVPDGYLLDHSQGRGYTAGLP